MQLGQGQIASDSLLLGSVQTLALQNTMTHAEVW